MIADQHAVQMIDLVLHHSGPQSFDLVPASIPASIEALDLDLDVPHDLILPAGKTETTLGHQVSTGVRANHWIHYGDRHALDFRDEEPLLDSSLRRGQADALMRFHQKNHLDAQIIESAAEVFDWSTDAAQDGVGKDSETKRTSWVLR